jgi:glutamate/tyrosine decarboxylase-like PLP-dependent enzyme
MADLAAEIGAWLHVDGPVGLFAAVASANQELVTGVDRAHSMCVDGQVARSRTRGTPLTRPRRPR